jgi:K+-sensing histidine kinase KdpD
MPAKSGAACDTGRSWQLSRLKAEGAALDFSHSNLPFCHPILNRSRKREEKVSSSSMLRLNQNAKEEQRPRLSAIVNSVIGALLCGAGAGAASIVAASHQWRALVPLAFTIVLLLIAVLFGSRAGILGTVLAATIFAAFLFQPLGNLSVTDSSARSNLAWMLLIGVTFSFLFAPPTSGLHRH